jgi:hypothetical protein
MQEKVRKQMLTIEIGAKAKSYEVKILVVYLSFTEYDDIDIPCEVNMDDNIWEYPFGDLEDDEELFDMNSQAGMPVPPRHRERCY